MQKLLSFYDNNKGTVVADYCAEVEKKDDELPSFYEKAEAIVVMITDSERLVRLLRKKKRRQPQMP